MADADSEADSEAAIVYLEDASALVDTRWELQSFNGEPLVTTADTKPVFFRVDSGQPPSLVGFGGCNRFYGTGFTATAETVAFGSVGSTRMACPNLGSEQIFIATLSKADRWLVESDSLTVMAGADATLVFGRVTNVVDEDVDQP
ncbi:MAG: heat shock protein HslJ [Myxococcota bacterium]|jgi:heat shock protein HslJ